MEFKAVIPLCKLFASRPTNLLFLSRSVSLSKTVRNVACFTGSIHSCENVRKLAIISNPLCRKLVDHRLVDTRFHSQSPETSKSEGSFEVVYKGTLSGRVQRVKILSLAGSVLGIACLPKILSPVLENSLASAVLLLCCSSFFVIVTPVMLHWICKRYVTELQFDSVNKQFRATVVTLFLRKKHINFTAEEVYVPGTPLLLTSFLVRGYPLLVDTEGFTDVNVYKHLMGFDKPMDFMLKNKEQQSS